MENRKMVNGCGWARPSFTLVRRGTVDCGGERPDRFLQCSVGRSVRHRPGSARAYLAHRPHTPNRPTRDPMAQELDPGYITMLSKPALSVKS